MEMLSYHELSKEDEAEIKEFLADTQILMLEPRTEAKAVAIRREHRLKLPDAVIVATAFVNKCILVTCDLDLSTKRIAGCYVEIPKELMEKKND
jgi:predicted nucleic acid-binding protein